VSPSCPPFANFFWQLHVCVSVGTPNFFSESHLWILMHKLSCRCAYIFWPCDVRVDFSSSLGGFWPCIIWENIFCTYTQMMQGQKPPDYWECPLGHHRARRCMHTAGELYALKFIDDFSEKNWVYPLKHNMSCQKNLQMVGMRVTLWQCTL